MSWDILSDEIHPCNCGCGTIRCVTEMDDWNRIRSWTVYMCPHCKKAHEQLVEQREAARRKRAHLLKKAQNIAKERYLPQWLKRFDGLSKKAIHGFLTDRQGYPSLATFYKHVKQADLERYMTSWFLDNILSSLEKICVTDHEITSLLWERDRIYEYRDPHPYQ